MFRSAALWAVAWTIPGLIWVGILALRLHNASRHMGGREFAWAVLLNWTTVGAISGAAFALALGLAERRKASLAALSMRRVAGWGAVGGAVLPIVLFPMFSDSLPSPIQQLVGDVVVYGALGAASAAASLYLARHAAPQIRSAGGPAEVAPPAT